MHGTPSERFDAKWVPEPNSGCWLWCASGNIHGYGTFWSGTRLQPAHVFGYERKHGPVPPGLDVDHKCRVRACVNPAHLRAVTRRVNLLCGETLPAAQVKRTHCPKGHAYDAANTYLWRNQRHCLACRKVTAAKHYQRRRADD